MFFSGRKPCSSADHLAVAYYRNFSVSPGNKRSQFVFYAPTFFIPVFFLFPKTVFIVFFPNFYKILFFQMYCPNSIPVLIILRSNVRTVSSLNCKFLQAFNEYFVAFSYVIASLYPFLIFCFCAVSKIYSFKHYIKLIFCHVIQQRTKIFGYIRFQIPPTPFIFISASWLSPADCPAHAITVSVIIAIRVSDKTIVLKSTTINTFLYFFYPGLI